MARSSWSPVQATGVSRADRKRLESLRREYDAIVAEAWSRSAFDKKLRVIGIVQELESVLTSVPEKVVETRKLFERQIRKAQ